jgi:hypothetical protein
MVVKQFTLRRCTVKDDLNKAEKKWATRSLFGAKPRKRRWRWVLLLLIVVSLVFIYDESFLRGLQSFSLNTALS